jgi:DNA (cytosine-5)-methyltransferase 1
VFSVPLPLTMLTSIELFTGAGGLALGVANAGFDHRMLVEYNKDACKSLRQNFSLLTHGACTLAEGDVKDVVFSAHQGKVDLLAAGAPCQPFSIGGKHRAHRDTRNLFPEVFRAVHETWPRAILVENVKGLLRASFAPYVEYIELQLAAPDLPPDDPEDWQAHTAVLRERLAADPSARRYHVRKQLCNAADYGVPQKRERVFLVATAVELGVPWGGMVPTHSEHALLYEQWVTGAYWERHGLRRPKTPERLMARGSRLAASPAPTTLPWRTVRDALHDLPEPKDRVPTEGTLNHVGQPGARSYPGHTGSALDAPAKTLKAGVHGVPGGENMLRRPDGSVRYFTVREAARLQTFPDTYHVQGAWGEALRQLGNAVPVQLAQAVASSVHALLAANPCAAKRRRRPKVGAGV